MPSWRASSGVGAFYQCQFPPEADEFNAQFAVECCAQWLTDTLGVAVEFAGHRKGGKIDHVHFLMTDRPITLEGVGKKIRPLNGLADAFGGGIETKEPWQADTWAKARTTQH